MKIDLARRAEIGRDRRAKTRAQILEAAQRLYSERSFETVTADDVVRKADIARGTFYIHFKHIDDLRAAVTSDLAQNYIDRVQPDWVGEDPVERIAIGCAGFIQEALQNPIWGGLVARGALAFSAVGQIARQQLAEDLTQAMDQKRISLVSLPLGMSIVVGAVLQVMLSASENRLSPSDGPAAVVAILMSLGVNREEATKIVSGVMKPSTDNADRA